MKSKTGLAFAGVYALTAIYLIATQGLFGESFIALFLGAPWTFGLAAIEFGGAEGVVAWLLIIAPMVLNAFIFYWAGSYIGRVFSR